MVGGEETALNRARPLFEVLGRKIVHVGQAGAGQVAKIANQVIVAGSIALVSEALVLSREAGVDPTRVIDALEGGFADSAILRNHGRRMLASQFEAGFRLQLQLKDVELAMGLARDEKPELDVMPCVREVVARAVAEGLGDLDHAALFKIAGRAKTSSVEPGRPT
jgi:2-hydroxy-3-oxopropionate reductase